MTRARHRCRSWGRRDWRGLAAAVLLFGSTAALEAGVKLVVRPDGTKMITGDGRPGHRSQPARRLPQAEVGEMIDRYARQRGLDSKLVAAVIEVESAYNVTAVSAKGAMGLMQLMPGTARELAVADPFDPEENIRGGTLYLSEMMKTFEPLEMALAAYNAGPDAVRRYGGIPPYDETRRYVQKVIRIYRDEPDYSVPRAAISRPGRKTFLFRDASGRLRMSTAPPPQSARSR